jgi:hypothetical protein
MAARGKRADVLDAAEQLGASPVEVLSLTGNRPPRLTRRQAAEALGAPRRGRGPRIPADHDWRVAAAMKFRSRAGWLKLIALLEREVPAFGPEPSPQIAEAIEHLLAFDRTQAHNGPQVANYHHAKLVFARMSRQWRNEQARRRADLIRKGNK